MKKIILVFGLILGLLFGCCNYTYASDIEKTKVISEIGTLTNSKNYDEALEKCNLAMKKYPKEAELYYWSGIIKSYMGDKKSALQDYNKLIAMKPQDSSAYVMRGICKSELNDPFGAIEDFNKALEINPKDTSAYNMRACVKIEIGDLNGANADIESSNKITDEIEQNIKNNDKK